MEPAGAAAHYNEKLALLPGLGTRYGVPQMGAAGTRADFGIPEDRTIYLVPQSLFKIHPDNDDLIARVLQGDPDGVAVMFTSHHEAVTSTFAVRLHHAFKARGVDLHDRTVFMARVLTHDDYMKFNELCD